MNLKKLITISIFTILLCAAIPLRANADSEPLVTQIATVSTTSLRMRSGPSTDHSIITAAPYGDYVMIIGKSGSWYRVQYNLKQGFMHENYLRTYNAKNTELGYGIVTGSRVNLRTGPGTSHTVVSQAKSGEQAYIIGFNRQWYKVIYKNDICYIRTDYLKLTEVPYENKASSNKPLYFINGESTGVIPGANTLTPPTSNQLRQKVVNEAKKHLGTPYLWGGDTPKGFDCSGFTQYVLEKCGTKIPRTTLEQYKIGTYVSKKDLQPGDLVFLQNTYRQGISHVGIYIGNDQIIHASSSKGVTISNLSSSYYLQHYYGSRSWVS